MQNEQLILEHIILKYEIDKLKTKENQQPILQNQQLLFQNQDTEAKQTINNIILARNKR